MDFFNVILIYPIINILLVIYKGLAFISIPYALGFAIILLTVFIRFLLYPLTTAQIKASQKMQKVAPHISKLKEKHKGDAKTLQQETLRLYKEHGVNPAAGCLPVLIQMPILIALYQVLIKVVGLNGGNIVSEVNKIVYFDFFKLQSSWDTTFFGISLGQNPSQLLSVAPLILLVPLITGALQYFQTKMIMPAKKEEDQKEKNKEKKEDFAAAFQKQSLYIFPAMIAFFSYSFPIGLSLYWNTFTVFGILQQYKIQKNQITTNS